MPYLMAALALRADSILLVSTLLESKFGLVWSATWILVLNIRHDFLRYYLEGLDIIEDVAGRFAGAPEWTNSGSYLPNINLTS